jgi:hypothetical protein
MTMLYPFLKMIKANCGLEWKTEKCTNLTDRPLKDNFKKYERTTAVWRNGGCSASYDSFVVKQTVVLRINICGENPPLRQAAKR